MLAEPEQTGQPSSTAMDGFSLIQADTVTGDGQNFLLVAGSKTKTTTFSCMTPQFRQKDL